MKEQYKFILDENDIPKQWYNIVPDLPNPLPPQLNPQTMDPIGPEAVSYTHLTLPTNREV